MKRFILFGLIIVVLGGGVFAYYQYGGTPEVRRERYLKKGLEYLKQSKLNEAVIEFRNAVKADPRSLEARLELGQALLKRGDLRAAHGELVRAVDLKPDSIQARYRLAMFQLGVQDLKSAKEHYEKIRAADRDAFETRSLGARIALAEKAPQRAINELKEILKKDPQRSGIYIDIGLIQFAGKDFKSAEANFRKALELDPKAANARVALAQLYLAMGNQKKGEEELVLGTQSDPENEALLHVLGLFYSITRRTQDFEKLYLDLLQKKPDSLIAKKRLAELYLAKGQVKPAREYAEAILKSQPGDIDGHFFRGRINYIENSFQKAIDDFAIVTRGSPRFGPGYYFLGLAQRAVNRVDEARKNMTRAIDLIPNWVPPRVVLARLHMRSGDADLALEQSDLLLKALPKNESLLVLSGAAQMRKGDVKKALTLFKKAVEVNPKSIAARMNIAAIFAVQRNYPQAIKEYHEVLRLDSDRVEALSAIAQLRLAQKNPKLAFDEAQKHLSKTENQAVVYQVLGQIKLATREYPQAIEFLSKAVEINPNLTSSYLLIGNAYAAQQKFDAAIEQYERILSKNPKTIPALMMTGLLYDQKKQTKKANEYYQKVLDVNKTHVLAANNLAYNYAKDVGTLDVALAIAQKAREANPNDPSLADTLGWIQYRKGAYLSAIGLLKESNEKFKGNNPEVLYHLGMAYSKNGDESLAAEHLAKALAFNKPFNGRNEAKDALAALSPKSK